MESFHLAYLEHISITLQVLLETEQKPKREIDI